MSTLLPAILTLAAALTAATATQDAPAPGADMPSDSPSTIEGKNRLGNETSPYLLQHRHNPVNWYPWGEEAFAAARALDRPIFLSVGYSTCYWCHVMERESFEDDATAAILNERYVAIKVDREERPDVDDIYMMAVNILNQGNGGWPMSVFLEPNTLKPFTAGTYFPPEDRAGRPGFKSVLTQIADAWSNQREAVMQHADRVADLVVRELSQLPEGPAAGALEVQAGAQTLLASYDGQHGGWGRRNKFPMPVNLQFLMLAGWDDESTRDAVTYTLDRMATGGIYDHIGGGFHRYSVDLKWLVPHFEKMLYDNAQLAGLYAEAYERTDDPYYARVVREVLDYVLRDMTAPTGAFYSAQDAEVNHREGQNYIWVADEIRAALTEAGLADDVDFALEVYGFNAGTNFQDPHHPEDGRKNVVYLLAKPADQAVAMEMTVEAFEEREARVDEALLAARSKRDQPITDDKVLTGWNGLMIRGMADGGRVLGEARYVDAAARAARFVLETMRDPATGELLRTYRDGTAKIPAFTEDYAFFVAGLLALYRATGDEATLAAARELTADARARFWDESKGGYFDTQAGQSDLFVRARSTYDGAVPSANGVMLNNLLDLNELTGDEAYLDDAVATLGSLSGVLADRPTGAVMSLIGLKRIVDDHPERLVDTVATVGPAPPEPPAGADGPVRITTSTNALEIADGAEGSFEITLDVADGYHVNSHAPGIDYLIPLEVKLIVGGGLALDVEYPKGEKYDGPEGAMMVHHGRVTLPVRVKRGGAIPAGARVALSYQICTDKVCLAPATVTLPIRFR